MFGSRAGRAIFALVGLAAVAVAHPMGNFSVNHYSRLYLADGRAQLTYVLDLAEIPAFQLLSDWKIDWKDQAALTQKSTAQAKDWLTRLVVSEGGRNVALHLRKVTAVAVEGAGAMPTLRISMVAEAPVRAGTVVYEDRNFDGRAGWKEIVIDHDQSGEIRGATQGSKDLSAGLTVYPADPSVTPPQDVTASVEWIPAPVTASAAEGLGAPQQAPAAAPVPQAPAPSSFTQQQPSAPGSVVKGDFLSRMLQQKQLGLGVILIGILAAFGLGAMHAMSPGHGKTIVAAYLVGSRGTLKHAGLLGFVVTFTHTFTVFLLGLGVLFFQQYVVPEKIVPVLGAISGLSIVAVGCTLLYQRAKALMGADGHSHSHPVAPSRRAQVTEMELAHAGQSHSHGDGAYFHSHDGDHGHDHGDGLVHSHGGSTHSHMIEGEITPRSLIALGISGGMVPCPSALILMLSAIALGHAGLGLILLIGFSSGLAVVLMGIGMLAIFAKHLLPDSKTTMQRPIVRLIPVFSAVVVICLGLVMTAVSAGWLQPLKFLA